MKNAVLSVVTCVALVLASGGVEAERASIAIVPFDNKAGIDQSVCDRLQDMLMTSLTKSRKFDVLERSALDAVATEQMFGASGAVDQSSAAEIGKLAGADFMLISIVTEAGQQSQGVAAYGLQVGKSSVVLAVDIRFVDSSTGKVRIAETFRESRSGVALAAKEMGFDISGGPGQEMARCVVDSVTRKVLCSVYPPKIIKVSETGVATLSYGDIMFTKEQLWDVYDVGEELIDPDTGESLGAEETRIGKLEISVVTAKFSKGKIVEGEGTEGAICRLAELQKGDEAKPKKKRRKIDPF